MQERGIEREWVLQVLTNWVAREFNSEHNSTGYFGSVPGRSQFLMVAVSESGRTITTVHFDSTATRHYLRRNYSYFDEVKNEPSSPL